MTLTRFLAVALLLSGPILGQTSFSDMDFSDVTITSVAASTPAPDWTSSFVAVYDFEDAWTTAIENHSSASCGVDCDMTISGTLTRTTTSGQYVSGDAAVSWVIADAPSMSCDAGTTCEEMLPSTGLTVGYWVKHPSAANQIYGVGLQNSSNYYVWTRGGSNDDVRCQMYDSSPGIISTPGTGAVTDDVWTFVACVFDETGDEMEEFVNGADQGTNTSFTGPMQMSTAVDPKWITNGAAYSGTGTGYIDEMWMIGQAMTEAEIARIGACGVDGSACTCNGTAWVSYGRSDTNCTGSGTPYACCTGSGTGCVNDALMSDDCNKANP